jgi:TetR/AcrR family transcriptional regulator, fatty acid metabolism regulator protein
MTNKSISKRRTQALETKDRIYSTAIDLMDREGFDNITIADISKKAGVSVGAFYHYFTSKNDILAEIFHKADEYFSTSVLPGLKTGSVPEKIVDYFDYYAKFNVSSGVELTQQLFNPKIKFFIRKDRPMITILEDLIQEGQEKKEIRTDEDPEELSRYLFVMARGIVFEWSVYEGSYDLEALMHKYMLSLVSTLQI